MVREKLSRYQDKRESNHKKTTALSGLSKSRTLGWVDNLTAQETEEIANGAIREGNLEKRQGFEGGNWRGQKITGELKHYDGFYVRKYEPDAIRHVRQQSQGGAHYKDFLKKEPYQAGGEKYLPPSLKFKQLLRQR